MKAGVIFLIVLSLSLVSAHQPRLIYDREVNMLEIKNPEISQAFYGELRGQEESFSMNVSRTLYIGILVPDILDSRTDFNIEILPLNISLNDSGEWESFYEEFAGDNYLKGPEFEREVSGNFVIKVSNKDNLGKYVLVVGKKEAFPFSEALNAVVSMPKLKSYFEKSIFTSFFNLIGLFLLVFLVVLAGVVILVVFIVRRIKR